MGLDDGGRARFCLYLPQRVRYAAVAVATSRPSSVNRRASAPPTFPAPMIPILMVTPVLTGSCVRLKLNAYGGPAISHLKALLGGHIEMKSVIAGR